MSALDAIAPNVYSAENETAEAVCKALAMASMTPVASGVAAIVHGNRFAPARKAKVLAQNILRSRTGNVFIASDSYLYL
jgi:hypothetical protein